jgi:iron only hydrogenase large subunit-like protein
MEPIQAPIVKKVEVGQVEAYLSDPTKLVVVQTAPAVRVSLGEFFRYACRNGRHRKDGGCS